MIGLRSYQDIPEEDCLPRLGRRSENRCPDCGEVMTDSYKGQLFCRCNPPDEPERED